MAKASVELQSLLLDSESALGSPEVNRNETGVIVVKGKANA